MPRGLRYSTAPARGHSVFKATPSWAHPESVWHSQSAVGAQVWVSVTLPGVPSFSPSGITALPPQLTPTVASASPLATYCFVGKLYSSKLSGERNTQLQGWRTQSRGPQHSPGPAVHITGSLGEIQTLMPQADLSRRLWGGARPAVCEGAPTSWFPHTSQGASPELCTHLTASNRTSQQQFQNYQHKEEKSITGHKPATSFLINILLQLWLPVSLLINLLVETLTCKHSNKSKQSERGRKSHHGAQSCSSEATMARSLLWIFLELLLWIHLRHYPFPLNTHSRGQLHFCTSPSSTSSWRPTISVLITCRCLRTCS